MQTQCEVQFLIATAENYGHGYRCPCQRCWDRANGMESTVQYVLDLSGENKGHGYRCPCRNCRETR